MKILDYLVPLSIWCQ